ncbi:MAG TPA: hypothetical protein VIY29_05540, partial [Ktedonobacteraceae bacterium]
NNPATNNNPNAILFVTPNWDPGGIFIYAFETHPLGVWYNPSIKKWAIFNEDTTIMPLQAAFNILAF